jgi:hypothetical protein
MNNNVCVGFALLMAGKEKIHGERDAANEEDEGEVQQGQHTVADAHEVHGGAAHNLAAIETRNSCTWGGGGWTVLSRALKNAF